MERLIELLNEYEGQESWSYDEKYGIHTGWGDDLDYECYIISKKFGFIKWLVENDKININEEWDDYEKTNLYCNSDFFQLQKHYSYYESLLMLLSISDSPIDGLISYLK